MRIATLLVALIINWVARSSGAESNRLNVLFIAVDDLRPELGCYGNSVVKSPNIDRLAGQGIRFNRAYCQFALCNPSRSSLLTGRRPETLKVYTLEAFVRDKNPDVTTLPQLFKQTGYETRSFGKIFHVGNGNHDDAESWSVPPWHTARDDKSGTRSATSGGNASKANRKAGGPSDGKADEVDPDTPDHSGELPFGDPNVPDEKLIDGQIARHAVAALKEMGKQPFFLAVGFHRPHLPFVVPKKYWDYYQPSTIPLATNDFLPDGAPAFASNDSAELRRYMSIPSKGPIARETAKKLVHGYFASVSYVDAQVGLILAELDRLGLRSHTVVILWGDHGYQLGEHGTWTKRTNWEMATRAPLILSVPGQSSAGRATDALVEFVDIYPTLATLCDIKLPPELEGISLSPLVKNPQLPWKTAAFSVYTKNVPEIGKVFGRAMRTDRFRFIRWTSPSTNRAFCELYDHSIDPMENVNLADKPESRETVERLSGMLKTGWRGALPDKQSR